MHHPIDTILKQLRQDVACRLDPEAIRSACRQARHTWRKCVLDPVAIVHWFVIQVLHGNTSLKHVARLGGGGWYWLFVHQCSASAGGPGCFNRGRIASFRVSSID